MELFFILLILLVTTRAFGEVAEYFEDAGEALSWLNS